MRKRDTKSPPEASRQVLGNERHGCTDHASATADDSVASSDPSPQKGTQTKPLMTIARAKLSANSTTSTGESGTQSSPLKFDSVGQTKGPMTQARLDSGRLSGGLGTPRSKLITVEVQPIENNIIVYQKVVPAQKGGVSVGHLYLHFDITNSGPASVILLKIDISFPLSEEAPFAASRFVTIKNKGGPKRVFLTGPETIKLIKSPAFIKILLTFSTGVVTIERLLGPHKISYLFFARAVDVGWGDFIQLRGQHTDGTGQQHFGFDAVALGWRDGKLSTNRLGSGTNEDEFAFGRPMYAIADGFVLQADDSEEDNPAPGKRSFVNRSTWTGAQQVKALAVAGLGIPQKNFILLASLSKMGPWKLTLLTISNKGESPEVLSEVDGGPWGASSVAVIRLSSLQAVTATRTGTTASVKAWEITMTDQIVQIGSFQIPKVKAVKLMRLTDARLVTASLGFDTRLTVSVHQITGNTFKLLDSQKIFLIGDTFDLVAVDANRFVTAGQAINKALRVVAWNFDGQLSKIDDILDEAVDEIAGVAIRHAGHFGTLVRQLDKSMMLKVWQTDADTGVITFQSEFPWDGPVEMVDATPSKEKVVVLMSRTVAGTFRLLPVNVGLDMGAYLFTLQDDKQTIQASSCSSANVPVPDNPVLATALTTVEGFAQIDLWQYTTNNTVKIFHPETKEISSWFHLKQHSIPPELKSDGPVWINVGEKIGEIGSNGTGTGVHVHFQVDRVKQDWDLMTLVQKARAKEDISFIRPVQFARTLAMIQSALKPGGIDANPNLTSMFREGVYFDNYGVIRK